MSDRVAAALPLPVPDFFDREHARDWSYRPREMELLAQAADWKKRHALRSAADGADVCLLLIDLQKDFCFPEGSLFVGGRSGEGAVADNERIATFIYRHLGQLAEIVCTLDSHLPIQIFFPSFWLDGSGHAPPAHTEITADEVRHGHLEPNPAIASWLGKSPDWLRRYAIHYCEALELAGRYRLYLWPPHCRLGSEGHVLAGVIQEARLFHAFARQARNAVEIKGQHPLTENYSALSPEVQRAHDGTLLGEVNRALVDRLFAADRVIVAGQAASHCVRSTLLDLLAQVEQHDPSAGERFYILEDCMSSVAVPDPNRTGEFVVDFSEQATVTLEQMSNAGMRVVRSTVPMSDWPA